VRYIDDRSLIKRNENGEITHYQGIVLDITERKLADSKYGKNQTRLYMLGNAA